MPTEIRQFLGLAGYYRRFIEGFSKIAKPMTKLTQKKVKFEWGDKQEAAFQLLKQKLCSAPILALPEGSEDFIAYASASKKGLGGCIVFDAKKRKNKQKLGEPGAEWTCASMAEAVTFYGDLRERIKLHHSIALYGRKCRSPVRWMKLGAQILAKNYFQETNEKIIQINAKDARPLMIDSRARKSDSNGLKFDGSKESPGVHLEHETAQFKRNIPPPLHQDHTGVSAWHRDLVRTEGSFNGGEPREVAFDLLSDALSAIFGLSELKQSYVDKRRKPLEFSVGDHVLLKVSPWKGVVRFGKKGKLAPRYVRPFEITERIGPIPLEEIQIDAKLTFVEESVEILEREIKKLKRSWIPIVKVRWNSKRGLEFTWEREDQMKLKYPHLFSSSTS
ncbi:putative reverse transcriptase domain-containing protein [Tanacetum coccineum]